MRRLSLTLFLLLAIPVLASPGMRTCPAVASAQSCIEVMQSGNCAATEEPRHPGKGKLTPTPPRVIQRASVGTISGALLSSLLAWLMRA